MIQWQNYNISFSFPRCIEMYVKIFDSQIKDCNILWIFVFSTFGMRYTMNSHVFNFRVGLYNDFSYFQFLDCDILWIFVFSTLELSYTLNFCVFNFLIVVDVVKSFKKRANWSIWRNTTFLVVLYVQSCVNIFLKGFC